MSRAGARAAVTIKRGRAKPIWLGHPWIYSEALMPVHRDVEPGALVDVLDDQQRLVGRGFFNPRSQIRVRMFALGEASAGDTLAFIEQRLADAVALRRRLGLPSTETNVYRLVNSEGDGLPGLVVDVYADVVVVQFTALGLSQYGDAIVDKLDALLAPEIIYGAKPGAYASVEGIEAKQGVLRSREGQGGALDKVDCRENHILLRVDLGAAQKTGMFLDQRENRATVRRLAAGARVFDGFTYHGGFALAAAAGGAVHVTAVDSSKPALAQAADNAARNGFSNIDFVESDVRELLEKQPPASYDVVLLDPPKFVATHKNLALGLHAYGRINRLGMRACKPGGLLVTSSCSGLVDETAFERMLAQAANQARVRLQVLERRAMGPDHPTPAAFPEGRYLKFFVCSVQPGDGLQEVKELRANRVHATHPPRSSDDE